MRRYWILIRDSRGYPIKVEIMASSPYNAIEMAKAMYGHENLISEAAAPVN